ncbi:hypothetical protein HVA01_11200 [Halovibrio variabilis]|uniref:Uncharacterized protein n=1 Tax=Halovibrio variabilis TaxID=31910 RepID=A0A511ULI2_9GAMM|nr:hypothetical protein HVA01_11200 [Halovibrio variabilis]
MTGTDYAHRHTDYFTGQALAVTPKAEVPKVANAKLTTLGTFDTSNTLCGMAAVHHVTTRL